MKKIISLLLIVIAAFYSGNAYSTIKGEKYIGILGGYNTQNKSALAGIAFQYRFSQYFRIAPNFQYVFKHNSLSAYQINLNTHYPLALDTKLNFYPIAGLTYQSWHTSVASEDSNTYKKFGFNIGAGFEYMATPSLKISVEGKYSWIKRYDSGGFFMGIGYLF